MLHSHQKWGDYMRQGLEKKDIALKQLRCAIQLYRQKDYVCATTLAGAAEEIFGKIAKKRTGTNALEDELDFVKECADLIGGEPAPRKILITKRTKTRNQLKHAESGENEFVIADFKFDSSELIDRTISNYQTAYGEYPKDRIIKKYISDFFDED